CTMWRRWAFCRRRWSRLLRSGCGRSVSRSERTFLCSRFTIRFASQRTLPSSICCPAVASFSASGRRPERRIPILIGAVSDKAVERAVHIGDGLIVYCGKPADLPARSDLLARALERGNRAREGFRFVATGIVHVDDDAESAWGQAAPARHCLSRTAACSAGWERRARDRQLAATPTGLSRRYSR